MMLKSGPMVYYAKELVMLDKHTMNALVKMVFLGTVREKWLVFEDDTAENREESCNEE